MNIRIHTYYSIQHAKSSALFARLAVNTTVTSLTDGQSELQSYVTATLFASFAFVEATINEIFAESEKGDSGMLKGVKESNRLLINNLYKIDGIEKMPTFNKCQLLFTALEVKFDKGSAVVQNMEILRQLRNNLIHYNSSWLDFDTAAPKFHRAGSLRNSKLWKSLGQKIKIDEDAISGISRKWINKHCAIWAHNTALQFGDYIFDALGVVPFISHIRKELEVSEIA